MSCGDSPGTNRKKRPEISPGDCYTNDSYRRAIHRACDLAFQPAEPLARREGESVDKWRARLNAKQLAELTKWQEAHRWSPHRLRHTAATEIRERFGLEAAQAALGHSRLDATQIYALKNMELAAKVARTLG